MPLPPLILERSQRVFAYHQASKLQRQTQMVPTTAPKPSPYRVFSDMPKMALSGSLLDAPVRTISLLRDGTAALPDSQCHPPQNLKTLSSWLYLAAGLSRKVGTPPRWLRPYPSNGELFPCEVYIAAFGVEDIEPGFYHFSTKEFALRRLRDGWETLARLRRGRPDLDFLKDSVAALFVSTIYCRSTWKYRLRGYRAALLDAGQLTENLVVAGHGLGIDTLTRLQLHDLTMNEILGLSETENFASAESAQSMIVWAENAAHPIQPPAQGKTPEPFALIARAPLANPVSLYGSIMRVHEDCVAPGVAVCEIRPPLTELSPLSPQFPTLSWEQRAREDTSVSLREALLTRSCCESFDSASLERQAIIELNQIAFRGGTYYPLYPDGPHTALVRPFWLLNNISGIESGIWYYDPARDEFAILRRGDYHLEAREVALDSEAAGNAAAICFLVVNLETLLTEAGPDAYRLANLEAGIAAQRLYLAACGMGLGSQLIFDYCDDAVRAVLGVHTSGWEVLHAVALGNDADHKIASTDAHDGRAEWRG